MLSFNMKYIHRRHITMRPHLSGNDVGHQGEGSESTGEIFATASTRSGS
ncbi:hypothetical protein JMUB7495_27370 [Staphylococcus aureus]